jgi:hypothetical protein
MRARAQTSKGISYHCCSQHQTERLPDGTRQENKKGRTK